MFRFFPLSFFLFFLLVDLSLALIQPYQLSGLLSVKHKVTVAAHFVTTAHFVTNEVVTNRAGIAPFFSLGYQYI